MFKYLMLAGLALFLPGLYALGYSIFEGPKAVRFLDRACPCRYAFVCDIPCVGNQAGPPHRPDCRAFDAGMPCVCCDFSSHALGRCQKLLHGRTPPRRARRHGKRLFAPGVGFLLHCRVCAAVFILLCDSPQIARNSVA